MAEALKAHTPLYATDLDRAHIREILKNQFMVVAYDYPQALAELKKYRMSDTDSADMLTIARDFAENIGWFNPQTQQVLYKLAQELDINKQQLSMAAENTSGLIDLQPITGSKVSAVVKTKKLPKST